MRETRKWRQITLLVTSIVFAPLLLKATVSYLSLSSPLQSTSPLPEIPTMSAFNAVVVPAVKKQTAAFIFCHGLGDQCVISIFPGVAQS
jgi:hypothetical protein